MKYAITAIAIALSAQAFATDNIYEGRGNIYKTHATLADLQSEATRLNSYSHGNTLAIQHHDGQIKDLQQNKADKSEVAAVNTRVDHTNKQVAANTKETVRLENVKADKTALKATDDKVGKNTTQISNNTTVINQHSNTLNEYGSKLEVMSSAQVDLDSRMTQYTQQTDARLNGLERDVDKLKEASAVGFAAASIQMCTQVECGFQVGVGLANSMSRNALAVQAGGAVSQNVFLAASAGKSGSTSAVGVSATYSFR